MNEKDIAILVRENSRLTLKNRKLKADNARLSAEVKAYRTASALTDSLHESVRQAYKKVKK